MNNIIKQLAQIEDQSVHILDEGAARKKELTAQYEEKTRQFDESQNRETEEKITALKNEMKASTEAQLDRQRTDANAAISRLEQHYKANHSRYVKALFKKITEV